MDLLTYLWLINIILWATPSAAGPRSLLIASGLQILGIVASGSWHLWYPDLSFGMLGGLTLASWGTLGRCWDTGEHNKGHLCYPDLSFGMLGGLTLASWGTLGRSWDIREHNKGHFEVHARISLVFVGFRDLILTVL